MALEYRIENQLDVFPPYATVVIPRFEAAEVGEDGEAEFHFLPWHRCRPSLGACERFHARPILSLQVEAPEIEGGEHTPRPALLSRPREVRTGYTYSILWHESSLVVREDDGGQPGAVRVRHLSTQRNQCPVSLHWSYGAAPETVGPDELSKANLLGCTRGLPADSETWLRPRPGAYLLPLAAHEALTREAWDVPTVIRCSHRLDLAVVEDEVAKVQIILAPEEAPEEAPDEALAEGPEEGPEKAEEAAGRAEAPSHRPPVFRYTLLSRRDREILRGIAVPPRNGEAEPS